MEVYPGVSWNIGLQGRSWTAEELLARRELMPEKREIIDGKLYWTDEDRLVMLALLLENLGTAAAVRIGSRDVWRQAIAELDETAAT